MARNRTPKSISHKYSNLESLFGVYHSKYGTLYLKRPSFPPFQIPPHLVRYTELFKQAVSRCKGKKGWVPTPSGMRTAYQVCIQNEMRKLLSGGA